MIIEGALLHSTSYRQSLVKKQLENIPSNNNFHISPFYLRYPRQPWLNFN